MWRTDVAESWDTGGGCVIHGTADSVGQLDGAVKTGRPRDVRSVLGGAVVTMRRLSTIPREAEEADGADGLAKSPSQLARGSRAREPRRSARDLQTSRAKGGGSS